jgi:hypothetical protein
MFKEQKQTLKAAGFAKSSPDGTAITMVDNYFYLGSDGKIKSGVSHTVIKILNEGYSVLYQSDDGLVSTQKGQIVATGENLRPRLKCSRESPAVRAAVYFDSDSASTGRLPLPEAPSENERIRIISQPTQLTRPSWKDFNALFEDFSASRGKTELEIIVNSPKMCSKLNRMVDIAETYVTKMPDNENFKKLYQTTNETRNFHCAAMSDAVDRLEKLVTKARKKQYSLSVSDCNLSKQFLSAVKQAEWPQEMIARLDKASRNACALGNP